MSTTKKFITEDEKAKYYEVEINGSWVEAWEMKDGTGAHFNLKQFAQAHGYKSYEEFKQSPIWSRAQALFAKNNPDKDVSSMETTMQSLGVASEITKSNTASNQSKAGTWACKAGINGALVNEDDVAFWVGGDLDDAIEGKASIVFRADGSGWLAHQNIMWDALGNLLTRGTFESNANGNRIVIDPNDRSIKMISGDTLVGEWTFEQGNTGGYAYRPTFKLIDRFSTATVSAFGFSQVTKNINGFDSLRTSLRPGSLRLAANDNDGTKMSNISIATEDTLKISLEGLPTSKERLSSGSLWRDGDTLKIVL